MMQAFDRIKVAVCIAVFLFGAAGCLRMPQETDIVREYTQEQKVLELLSQGTEALRRQTPDGVDFAHGAYTLAYELKPRDARVQDGLGAVAFFRGQLNDAEAFFKSAAALDPNYDRPYAHLALVAEKRGDLTAARELLLIALRMNPLNYRARNNYATLLLAQPGGALTDRRSVEQAYKHLLRVYQTVGVEDPVASVNMAVARSRREPLLGTVEATAAGKR